MELRVLSLFCIIVFGPASAVWADSMDVELVGMPPFGAANAVYMVGNYAYVCVGRFLVIVDVSDLSAPSEVAYYNAQVGLQDIYIADGYAYIASSAGLRVVDISNSTFPHEVGYCDTRSVDGVHISGAYAYVTDWHEGLQVIDISDPTNPTEVGFCHITYTSRGVYVVGNYAYVCAGSRGLRIIDVSDPTKPYEVGSCEVQGSVQGVYVTGGYAYVADNIAGFRVIDVSDPLNPYEVGFCDVPDMAEEVYVTGGYAYVANGLDGLHVINVSDPTAPQVVGICDTYRCTGHYTLEVYVTGDYAYVANADGGLLVIDISDPTTPNEVGFYDVPQYPVWVYVAGDYAYVADLWEGLHVIDISDSAKPRQVALCETLGGAKGVYVTGGYAYVADWDDYQDSGLQVIDVSDPAKPHEVGYCDTPQFPFAVHVIGSYAYVADRDAGLRVIDVFDPSSPHEVGLCEIPGDAWGVYVANGYAYMADSGYGLRVVDVSDPKQPHEVGFCDTPDHASGVYVAGTYAYVADGNAGLRVIDVSDPEQPQEVGFYDTPGLASNVHVAGSYAYLADHGGGLRVIDVSDPSSPHEVGFYQTNDYAQSVYVAGGYAYVVAGDGGGLCILRYTGTTNQAPDPPINLVQFKSDGRIEIPVGGTTDEQTVILGGTVSDPDGDRVRLQVELRRLDEFDAGFNEGAGGFKESAFVESGSEAVAHADGLIDADYHWRARAVDEHGKVSEWIDFGNNDISEADFSAVTSEPDLELYSVSFSPEWPTAMEETNVNLIIRNDGGVKSPPGNLKVSLFVSSESPFTGNFKLFQGEALIDLGEIDSIEPGGELRDDVSFPYTFFSNSYSRSLEVELHLEHGMDSDLTNNTFEMKFKPAPNLDAYWNCFGELLTIASAGLLDGIDDIKLAKDAISCACSGYRNQYKLLSSKPGDIQKVLTIFFFTRLDIAKTVLKLTGKPLAAKVVSYASLLIKGIYYESRFLGCGEVLKISWDAYWKAFMKARRMDRDLMKWVYFFFVNPLSGGSTADGSVYLNCASTNLPADLIVEDSFGNTTTVIQEAIIEGIEDSFGIKVEDHKVIAVIGDDVYTVKVKGTSTGECDLSVFKPGPNDNLVAITYENVPTTDSSEAILVVGQQIVDYTLIIDNDGDGLIDEARTPDTVEEITPFTIALATGWNLTSIPVQLPDNSLETVLQSIAGNYKAVWAYDGEWERYIVGGPDFLNTLETMESGRGYWIQMTDSAVLTLDGDEVADEPIPLWPGWNLVGYNSLTILSIEEALSSIAGNYNSVWTYGAASGKWKRYILGGPAFLNDLETMHPGKGYWINAVADCTWDVNVITPPAAPPVVVNPRSSHISTNKPEIPYTIWGSVETDGVKMTGKGRHRGTAPTVLLKVNNKVQSSYQLGTVGQYGDFYVLDVPGTTDSSTQIELYVQIGDTVMKAAPVPPTTNPGEIMRLDLSVQVPPPKVSLLYQNYPNPFNPDTWIPYQLVENADVNVKIYNVVGQLVKTLDLGCNPAGFYTSKDKAAYWDSRNATGEQVASGVYFYTIQAGDFTATKKMVATK